MPEQFECEAQGSTEAALDTNALGQARAHFKERRFHLVQRTKTMNVPDYGSRLVKLMAYYLFEADN